MGHYSGNFQYLDERLRVLQEGQCRLSIEDPNLRVIPEKGQPLALDLGDIEVFSFGDYDLILKLYTGKAISLSRFAKAFQNLAHDLREAYRTRLIQCMLLLDLEEIDRFEAFVEVESPDRGFSSPAQLRLYRSNLAVIPDKASGLQWRLTDFDSLRFDESTYRVTLRSGPERLVISKLAKRTGEFLDKLRSAVSELSDQSAKTFQGLFPFLTPDEFQSLSALMKEGHSAPMTKIAAVNPRVEQVLMEKTVDEALRPYFDFLRKKMAEGCDLFTGFKMIRPEEGVSLEGEPSAEQAGREPDGQAEEARQAAPDAQPGEGAEKDKMDEQVLHWFFFPLLTRQGLNVPANVLAWEAASHSGRATYFFRITPDTAKGGVEASVESINRALLTLNFRREPIYLGYDALLSQARYRRYAIACRRIPVLRDLRAAFIGRAIHTSPEAWQKQVVAVLSGA